MTTFTVSTDERHCVQDVTEAVAQSIPADHVGLVNVFVEHTTAGVLINEAEARLIEDFEEFYGTVVADEGWAHDRIDDNADAHLRASFVGPSATIPVESGDLALGTWQSILLLECDGPRTRTVRVTPVG